MRPIRITMSALGASAPIPMDNYQAPFNVGLGVSVAADSNLTYTVQHTFDDVLTPGFNPATATWYSHATLAGKTTSLDGNYAYTITAIRLSVTAYTAGAVTLTVIQSGA